MSAPSTCTAPYEVGQRLRCEWRNGELRDCEIIERRTDQHGSYQYYVHYSDFNRRLDEWVNADRVKPLEPQMARPVSEKKRKIDPAVAAQVTMPSVNAHDESAAGELDAATQREHEAATRVKNINKIVLGKWEIHTWYYSPFPKGYAECDTLFFCEFDLHFVKSKEALLRYLRRNDVAHPPGDEIYRCGNISVFEIDGAVSKIYCQNLCLLAKLFLDHKTLYYDVDPFLFYVMTENDDQGCHPVAYFSKEKRSAEEFNLACILTLPPYQRKGYGRFLISFSYELSRKEGKVGTPERPLSDLGMVSYRSYWSYVLLSILQSHRGAISIRQLSEMSAIKMDDIVSTLHALSLIKYWKGQHMISVSPRVLQEHLSVDTSRSALQVDVSKLQWTPHNLRAPASSS
ncbi:MAG: hypothetical protein SGPRY_005609 [Prymnesium sp.]